jgi:phosphatidylinositol alpha-1,6-mannosyltransferase
MDDLGYKGHGELIACWPKVVAMCPDARLVIVGEGPARKNYQRLAEQSSCSGQIEFRGFVRESKMADIWSIADVFAMPSRGEGFGLVYIEAMRHGVPVIASIHDAGSEVNVDGETGYNVNLNKEDELPERINYLLRNRDMAERLGLQGQQRWMRHFTYTAFKNRFQPILWDFVSGGA